MDTAFTREGSPGARRGAGRRARRAQPAGRAFPRLLVRPPGPAPLALRGCGSQGIRADHWRRRMDPYLSNSGRVRRGEPRLLPEGSSRIDHGDSSAAAASHSLSFLYSRGRASSD